jgi:GNAT superfamily N-acetyltransferase
MGALYAVEERSATLGRESMPHWTHQELLGAYRSKDSGERQEVFGVFDGDRLLGFTSAWFPLLDNTDKVYVDLHVDPSARRQGVGRALVDELERRSRADGRTMLLADSKLPPGQRDSHPYRLFADALGFEFSNVEVVRHLALPVPADRIEAWLAQAADRHAGYTIATYVDEFPDELAESLCTLLGQLAVDAPTGLVDFEE